MSLLRCVIVRHFTDLDRDCDRRNNQTGDGMYVLVAYFSYGWHHLCIEPLNIQQLQA